MPTRLAATLVAASIATLILVASEAQAACAPPGADALTFRQMIEQGRTRVDGFPVMIVGTVVSTRDLGGRPGGRSIAVLTVAAHPTRWAPRMSRVRFWRAPPGVGAGEEFEFREGGRYVVIAARRPDRTFDFDGACGRTRRVTVELFRRLVELAHQQPS
jgi:hypothetical protein